MITPFKTTNNLTVTGNVTASNLFYDVSGNSSQWNTAYSTVSSLSANWNTAYSTLSTNPYILNQSLSSTSTLIGSNTANNTFSEVLGGQCNIASGVYSTVVNGFSSCATGFLTFVGAGSGNRAIGDYSAVVGGRLNTSSACYGFVGGGRCNTASGIYSVVGGGSKNIASIRCASVVGGAGNTSSGYGSVVGGQTNTVSNAYATAFGINNIASGQSSVALGCTNFASGGQSVALGMFNTASGCRSIVIGGRCNTSSGTYANILGGLGNYNPLRDSIIGGGVANHTGGFAPVNITVAASISGNGTQTCLNATGIQNCFSYPFNSGNVSVYYGSAANPLSAGCFSTATIAATGTNYIIINGDYSTCTASGLSATSIYVYDRAINNTGYDNVIGGGKLNTASGCYSFVGGGKCNTASNNFATVVGGTFNTASNTYAFVGGGCCNNNSSRWGVLVGGCANTVNAAQFATIVGGRNNTASNAYDSIVGGQYNTVVCGAIAGGAFNAACGTFAFVGGGNSNGARNSYSTTAGGRSNLACGNYSAIVGGFCNTASGNYSFVAGGSANDTKGFANTFILGTALSATQANTTYVNNISAQGIVYSNPPVFSGYGTQAITFPTGSWAKVVIDTKEADTNNNFNTTLATGFSGRFTPTIPGYYQLNGSIQLSVGAPATQSAIFAIFKNGVEFRRGSRIPMNTAGMGLTISQVVSANGTGDYFELYLNQGSSGTVVNENSSPSVGPQFNGVFVRSL